MTIGKALKMARIVPDIREYVTLEQAGLLMRAAYEMGLKRGTPDALALEIAAIRERAKAAAAIVGGEG